MAPTRRRLERQIQLPKEATMLCMTNTIRMTFIALVAALGFAVAAGSFVPATADAAAPRQVKVGSSGNAKLDDICRQMGDLINSEIGAGWNEESMGHYGEARAWWNQADEHIKRAQELGCVMSIRHVMSPARYSSSYAGVATRDAQGQRHGSGTSVRRKRISGTSSGKSGDLTQSQCDDYATWTNQALDKEKEAADSGHPDVARGWHQYANELLEAGRLGGCSFSAALMARAGVRAMPANSTGVSSAR
jgi:hypothetical protein